MGDALQAGAEVGLPGWLQDLKDFSLQHAGSVTAGCASAILDMRAVPASASNRRRAAACTARDPCAASVGPATATAASAGESTSPPSARSAQPVPHPAVNTCE